MSEYTKSDAGYIWLAVFLLLTLVGLEASTYLSVIHWKVYNVPGHVSFCAVSETINCDTVALSSYSWIAGLPLSTWGIMFYSLLLVLGLWGFSVHRSPWPWGIVGILNAAAVGLSAFLLFVSELIIHSFCIMCITLYVVNVLSSLCCVLGARSRGLPVRTSVSIVLVCIAGASALFLIHDPAAYKGWLVIGGVIVLALIALVFLNLRHWCSNAKTLLSAFLHDLVYPFHKPFRGVCLCLLAGVVLGGAMIGTAKSYPPTSKEVCEELKDIAYGHTRDGHPWIGAKNAEVTIYEYSDYECPVCPHAHKIVRDVVRENKDWLRFVHVHMPLDHTCNKRLRQPFHYHACLCALCAICASEQNAFWPMNDRLFSTRCKGLEKGGIAMLSMLAKDMGLDVDKFRACMKSQKARKTLQQDLDLCQRLGLQLATPTFRVKGKVITGLRNKEWWNKVVHGLRNQS